MRISGTGPSSVILSQTKWFQKLKSETAFSNSNVNYFWPIKTLPRSSKSCDCVTFGVLRCLLLTFLLYTPHCHMILSKQKCCLLSTGVSTESQKRTSVLQLRQGFLATRNMTRINVGLARSYVNLLLSLWKTYVQFDGMVYQQIVGIPMGTNCAPLIADLFLYCYERDFMSDLQKSKRFDLIDMFNDTSRYLDDIFTIDYPEFEKHIPDIYPAELQLIKANTSDKETSFFDLNIKVIGSDIHTSVYDKRDDFGFPIVNFPWLSGDVPRLPSYGIYISQLVRFARCCTHTLLPASRTTVHV